MADIDDERVERDSDEGEPPAAAKAGKSPAKALLSTEEEILVQLKEIRVMIAEGREQQSRYLWLLFPIGAILLVQTILEATRF